MVIIKVFFSGLLEIHGGHIEPGFDLAEEWQTVAAHYGGVVAIIVIGVIFGVMLPIVGYDYFFNLKIFLPENDFIVYFFLYFRFCFCCCRCAGNCGARSQPFDKKHDKCRKHLLATFLICIATVFL